MGHVGLLWTGMSIYDDLSGPVNFCRCERYTNEWNGTGTGPERDRNANRNMCEHGLR